MHSRAWHGTGEFDQLLAYVARRHLPARRLNQTRLPSPGVFTSTSSASAHCVEAALTARSASAILFNIRLPSRSGNFLSISPLCARIYFTLAINDVFTHRARGTALPVAAS